MKITIAGIKENGFDCLTNKEGEVLTVTTEDGFLNESDISLKSLMSVIRMKVTQKPKPAPKAELGK